MTEFLEQKLVNTFPELCRDYKGDYRKTCFAWGFECYDGWYDLIAETLHQINIIAKRNNLDVWLAQVKQKFGKLVIYIDYNTEEDNDKAKLALKEIYDIIRDTEFKSGFVSEVSGFPGKTRVVNSYYVTITDIEFEKIKEHGFDSLIDN